MHGLSLKVRAEYLKELKQKKGTKKKARGEEMKITRRWLKKQGTVQAPIKVEEAK